MVKLVAAGVVAMLCGSALYALAQPRIDVRPAVTPMGTSSSGGVSFAWFYDAQSRTVYLCRAAERGSAAPDCRSTATLP